MTPEQERAAWHRHNLEQLRQWRDLPFRQKLQCLEDMAELAATLKPIPAPQPVKREARPSSFPGT